MLPTRPMPPSLTMPYHDDPPANIGRAMGGQEFFFRTGAKTLHRIGIFLGLGWRLPFGEARHGIDYIRVVVNPRTNKLDMQFLHAGERPPEEAEPIRGVGGLSYRELLSAYEENT